jgi:hypothetical protein
MSLDALLLEGKWGLQTDFPWLQGTLNWIKKEEQMQGQHW